VTAEGWRPVNTREFLRCRNALLVHFSTVMSSHDYRYPADLYNAWDRPELELSFSTILPGDTFKIAQGGRGGAEGSVGLLIDIGPETVVRSVHHDDSGSSEIGSFGHVPSKAACSDSITMRANSNEWRVSKYRPIGIFILGPPYLVRQSVNHPLMGQTDMELEITLDRIVADFPSKRIISANTSDFIEYRSDQWSAVAINVLMPE